MDSGAGTGRLVRVLLVGDHVDPATLAATLETWGISTPDVVAASTSDEAMSVYSERRVDCVVCPLYSSPVDGTVLVPILHAEDPDVPIVVYPERSPESVSIDPEVLGTVAGYRSRDGDTDAYDGLAELIANALPTEGPPDPPDPDEASGDADGDREEIEDLTETLIENSSDVLSILTRDGTFDYVSPAIEHVMGYPPGELEGTQALEYVHPEDRQHVRDWFLDGHQEWEADQRTLTYRFRVADGDYRRIESIARSYLSDPRIEGIVMNSRDVTRREQRKTELERFETIIQTMPTGVVVIDADGYVEWANEAFYEPMGKTEAAVLGTHFLELVHEGYFDEDILFEYEERIRKLLSSDVDGDRERYEVHGYPADDDPRIIEAFTSLLPLDDGEFHGSVTVFRQVTERREYQRDLDLLGQVLTRVLRHNVRNSLNVMEGYAELLAEGTDGVHAEWASAIVDEADELSDTSRKARSIQRVLTREMERRPVDVAGAVREQVESLREQYPEATVETDLPGGKTWVLAIPELPTALENVLTNAVDHNDADAPGVAVSVETTDEHVDVVVADDGPGIPEQEAAVIERREETPLEHASGIGLWLVKWILERSDGAVAFDETDRGSQVRLRLEAASPGPNVRTGAPATDRRSQRGSGR